MASGDLLDRFGARDLLPYGTAQATPDTRNNHPVLDFDGAVDEETAVEFELPPNYAGGGLTVRLSVSFESAITGTSRWQGDIERMDTGLDKDADSFTGTFQSVGIAAPGTSGQDAEGNLVFTSGAQMDSAVAGERIRMKIRRDADGTSGTDDITTDAELSWVRVRET